MNTIFNIKEKEYTMQVKAICIMRLTTTVLFMAAWYSTARAESVYQLNASTTEGVDLTAMESYYADRMEGPSSGNITFSGPLKVDPSISATNPFQLIGRGKQITVDVAGSGFHSLPLKLYNADGVTGVSTLRIQVGNVYAGQSVDIGNNSKFLFRANAGNTAILQSGQITVHDNGILEGGANLVVGDNSSVSVSLASGASIVANYSLYLGRQTQSIQEPITVQVLLENSTVSVAGSNSSEDRVLYLLHNCDITNYDTDSCRVVIGENGIISANQIQHHGGGRSAVIFDGGKFVSNNNTDIPLFRVRGYTYQGSYPSPQLFIKGENGNPIDIEIAQDRDFSTGSAGGRQLNITGVGGFRKQGNGTLYFNRLNASTCDYTGPTTILGGGIVVSNAAYKVGRGELALSEGAFLDLNGFDVEFCGATGVGIVTNRAETSSSLTLGYGNADSSLTAAVGERISIVKTGTGTLTVSGAALANTCDLTIEGGKVVFAGDSSSYGTVTVMADGILDITGVEFSCQNLVKNGGKVLPPPGFCVILF